MLNRVSLRQMEYFVATAKHGGIAAASAQIHISSPSISAAIAHIEAALDVQLFVRHPSKGLGLTAIGTRVLRQCEDVLERSSQLYDIASDSSDVIQGSLRVGSFQSLTPMIAPEVIFGFARAFAKVDLQMVEGDQEVLMNKLHALEIDLAITYDLHLGDDIEFETLATLPPYVLVSELHPLAEQSAVTLEELAPEPYVLLDLPMSRDYFTALFARAGVRPNIVARSRSEEVVRSMVANGIGYTLFNVRPRSNLSLDGKRTVRVRLAGDTRPMHLGLATYKPLKQTKLTRVFMERCRAFISDQYIPGMSAASFFDPHISTAETPSPPTMDPVADSQTPTRSEGLTSAALLEALIAFPSVSLKPNIGLIEKVREMLTQAGIESTLAPDPQDARRTNLFASVGPQGVPGVLLSGHTDVVPADGQPWTTPAFEASRRDGRIYGRGSADMKGFVACAINAMLAAARRPLLRPLQLALSFDEEIGCVGVRHLLQRLESSLPAPYLCIVGEPTMMRIGTGHKGKAAYRAVCCGQAGHSGLAPRFINAVHMASDLVASVRDVQRELSQTGPREEGYGVPYSTVHVGVIQGGRALNIVPSECELSFEIRNVSEDQPEQILERILHRLASRVAAEAVHPEAPLPEIRLLNSYPGLNTPQDSPAVDLLASLLPPGTPRTRVDYGTEGGLFKQSWSETPVLVCGPGSIEVAHKADEYVELSQLEACDRMLAGLVDFLCR